MALNALRGRSRDREESDSTLEIGAPDRSVIGCPVCSRPIAANAGRCPGCGTRLMIGVPYRRAGIFLVTGAVVGMFVGGATIGSAMTVTRPGSTTGDPTASGGPTASAAASGRPIVNAPIASLAALHQAIAIDGRLSSGVEALKTSLAAQPFDSFAVAQTLRALAADAAVGSDAATRLKNWPDAADVQTQLGTVYEAVRATAREGLATTLANPGAYKDAARRMITVLGTVSAADGAARDLATASGLDVAPAP